MRSFPCALAVLACQLCGQGPTADFAIYPDSTSATSRSGIPHPQTGDLLVQVRRDSFRGVGTTQSSVGRPEGLVLAFSAAVQTSGVAPEPFNFAVYRENPAAPGQPDPAGLLLRTATLLTPPGPGAFEVSATLGTPAAVIPRDDTWYCGVGLFPASVWFAGGLSVHMASYAWLGGTFPRAGDNPRAGAPNVTWTVQGGLVAQPSPARTHRIAVHTDGVVLHNGADIAPAFQVGPNPNFGVAGTYPDNSGRGDGLAFRVRDPRSTGGPVAILAAPAFGPATVAPFLAGFFLIDLTGPLPIAGGTMPAAGQLVLQPPFLAQGQLPPGISGTVAFQAFTVGGGLVRASNATVTSLQ